ncbi:hypothetical protein [Treponema sp. UBA3813]|uniref:hypothetical protein n=1 Tax=Treponema sp. UBA3813 TaxID=1947715 RepID=UPI0025DEE8FB|nr:hypothetical protein [Treponema sp. UBA3813]
MKKAFLVFVTSILMVTGLSAQVLQSEQMKNTAWSGIGSPIDGDPTIYGFTDTFQARFDRGKFTVEGMLNWSFLANYKNNGDVDYFTFGTSNLNPLSIKYGIRNWNNGTWAGQNKIDSKISATDKAATDHPDWLNYSDQANVSNTLQDSYYVNVLYHFTKEFEAGVGTKLNWQVGPAPRYGSWLWEPDAHVRQGGFSTAYDDRAGVRAQTSSETVGSYLFHVDRPGSADVVGFVPYANKYAKRAVGVRYKKEGDMTLELGAAIPNGFNTDDPVSNFGAQFAPVKWLSIAAAIEGAFDDGSNFYSGATLGMDFFILDLYFAADSLFTKEDDDQAYGTGAAISFTIPNTELRIRPELGVNLFENSNYTFAWYTGGTLSMEFTDKIGFNVWGSFAMGSKDKRWDDYDSTKDWNGGHIFNVRPEITFEYTKQTSFAAYFDFENREAFDHVTRNCWSTGLYMTHTF